MGEKVSRRAALALGVGGAAAGATLLGAPAAQAAASWTSLPSARICRFMEGKPTVDEFVGAARWAIVAGLAHVQFVFRAVAVPPVEDGAPMWALDFRIGVGGVGDPPVPDVFRPVLPGQAQPDPVNALSGVVVAHKTSWPMWYVRGGHVHVIAGFEPADPSRYVLMAHELAEPPGGSAYVKATEPFAWEVGDIVKGWVAYPPI